jgi:hypothetical protein
MATKKPKYPTVNVFIASAMAYRINNGYVNGYEQDPVTQKSKILNKDIMQTALQSDIEFNADDISIGNEMYEHFKGILFKGITNRLNNFETAISQLIVKDELSRFEFGIVASLGKVYNTDIKREKDRDNIASVGNRSEYISTTALTKKTFLLDINILTSTLLPLYNCWTVTAKTVENNLVGFYMKTDPITYIGKNVKIRCRVKDRKVSRDGFKTTYLNYVKLLSEAQ